MTDLFLILFVIVVAGAAVFLLGGRVRRASAGMPRGAVVYQDTQRDDVGRSVEHPLRSEQYGLVGKPDYIVEEEGYIIPVEVKTSRNVRQPRESHVIQLYAYCLLVEEEYGITPPYGILHYPDRSFTLQYGEAEREWVLDTIEAVRAGREADDMEPNHDQPARCRSCQFLDVCGMDRLAEV